MVTIAFRFSGGRYHATPWGHQVNEGRVEWPPSPWRLLRALLSSGYTRLGWESPRPEVATQLMEKLCGELPTYYAPETTIAHSRHYMPVGRFQTGRQIEATTLVLDTWINVADEELHVVWNVALTDNELLLLGSLAESLNYLGRSESWVEARVLPSGESGLTPNVVPHDRGTPVDRNQELVGLVAPVAPDAFLEWRSSRIPPPPENGKKKPTAKQLKEYGKLTSPYPAELIEALEWDTNRWQECGWSQPPGSQVVQYRRSRTTLRNASSHDSVRFQHPDADMVLLALGAPSGSTGLLPSVCRTVPQAELIHRALVNLASVDGQVPPTELTGRDADRSPLRGHEHTHVLPLDLDKDGHLDHVLLWAKMGFSGPAQEAMGRLRRTFTKGGKDALRVAIAGRALRAKASSLPEPLQAFLAPSRCWVTQTPFVAPRFPKQRGRNSLVGQIRSELESRGFPTPTSVIAEAVPRPGVLPERVASRFRHFVRSRARGGIRPPIDAGWYVQVEFAAPVAGPVVLGYGSHFGLGLMCGQ